MLNRIFANPGVYAWMIRSVCLSPHNPLNAMAQGAVGSVVSEQNVSGTSCADSLNCLVVYRLFWKPIKAGFSMCTVDADGPTADGDLMRVEVQACSSAKVVQTWNDFDDACTPGLVLCSVQCRVVFVVAVEEGDVQFQSEGFGGHRVDELAPESHSWPVAEVT